MKKYIVILCSSLLFLVLPQSSSAQSCCPDKGTKLGLEIGVPVIAGEVRSAPRIGALSLSLEKPLNQRISLRYQITGMDARGQDWRPSSSANFPLFRNYRNLAIDQNLQLMVNLCGPYSKARIYLVGGAGVMGYHTETDLLDDMGMLYSHESFVAPSSFGDRKTVLDALNELQNGHFETPLKGDPLASGYGKNLRIRPSLSAGIGADFPIGDRLDLSLAYRVSWHGDQYLDGYNTTRSGLQGMGADLVHLPSAGIKFRFGKNGGTACCDVVDVPDATIAEASANQEQVDANTQRIDELSKDLERMNKTTGAIQEVNKEQNRRLDAQEQQTAVISESIANGSMNSGQIHEQSLFFETGESKISNRHYGALAQVSAFAQAYPNKQIEVRGYADAQGNTESNQALANKRAEAVSEFLQETFEVPAERINIVVVGDAESPQGVAGYYRRVTVSLK